MRATLGAVAGGAAIAGLILAVGATAAAWIAVALCVLAIVAGAFDYVRTHG